MQRVIMTAAAALVGAGLSMPAAKADMHVGPLTDPTTGLCFKSTGGDLGFGYWTECPKSVAAPVAHHHHRRHSAKNAD
jgi:hypothetical protein